MLTTPPEEALASFCRLHGLEPDLLARALEIEPAEPSAALTPAHQVEIGEISQKEFDAYLARALSEGRNYPLEAEGLSNCIIRELRPVPTMVLAVRRLREAGVQTALLSNSWGQEYPMQALSQMFRPDRDLVEGRLTQAPAGDLLADRGPVASGSERVCLPRRHPA